MGVFDGVGKTLSTLSDQGRGLSRRSGARGGVDARKGVGYHAPTTSLATQR
jgi:hypothetical protein